MKAMAKSPDDRYQSAEELRADLLRFADGRPVEAEAAAATTAVAAVAAGATTSVAAVAPHTESLIITGQNPAVPRNIPGGANRSQRTRTRQLVALLVTLLVVLAVIAFFLLQSFGVFGNKNVAVPSVVGESAQTAQQTLQNNNLRLGSTTRQTSASVQSGNVISSSPKAGTKLKKNSPVDLVISAGPKVVMVTVPTVVNDQLATAIAKLKAAKLGYTVVDVSSNRPTNTVLKQTPSGGTQTASTTQIVLTVVGTQTSVSVPNVVGDTPAAAGAQLSSSQLTLGTQSNACSSSPTGVVSGQTPAAGANVPPQTPVNLVVSSGSCVTVPNVVGDSESDASSTMTGDNLVPQFTNDTGCNNGTAGPGEVDGQTPAANAQVNPNSTVNMTICTPSGATTTTTGGGGGDTTTTTTTSQGLL